MLSDSGPAIAGSTADTDNCEVTMDGYIITEPLNNGVAVVQFPAFSGFPELVHAFSTRRGGVSEGIYSTMNFRFGIGDADDNVREKVEILIGRQRF